MTTRPHTHTLILALSLAALSACTTIPEQLQGDYPPISPARVDPSVFGSNVRWGGVIIDAKNTDGQTCFEILSRDLGKYMRPRVEDRTAGRFIACKSGFHDPAVFSEGREVTITGTIKSIEERRIDEFNYRYPILDVDDLVLWQKRRDVIVYNHTGPYYSPWYWGYGYGPHWGYYPYYWGHYPMYGGSGYAYTRQTLPDPADIEPRR